MRARRARNGCLAFGLTLVISLGVAEVLVRWIQPRMLRTAGVETTRGSDAAYHPKAGLYQLDEELGYVPVPGRNGYSELGLLENDYDLQKPEGVERLLFLGDSVTHRAKIVHALRYRLQGQPYEFWNAGVEAYGTAQEVGYYERTCADLDADHVILTFHLNDFEVTPTMFLNDEGELVLFQPASPLRVRPWWYRHSHLYRLYLATRVRLAGPPEEGMDAEIEAALTRLRDLTQDRGVRLSVLILPLLGTHDDLPPDWPQREADRIARIQGILGRLGIRAFDLSPPHRQAMAEGIAVRETPQDPMHPSQRAALAFADYVLEQGLLD